MARYEWRERPGSLERYERTDRHERMDRYGRVGRSRGSRWDRDREREPVRVPRRVVRPREQSDWGREEWDDEDELEKMARRPTKRCARSTSFVVPQSVFTRADIDAVVKVAEHIQNDNVEVARILYEYAYSLTQQMDPSNQGRGDLEFKFALKSVLMQKRIKHHIDRSKDLDILTGYHKLYKAKRDIATLDAEERAARKGRAVQDENPEYQAWRTEVLRRFYEVSKIFNKAGDFLATVSPAAASSGCDPARRELGADTLNMEQFKACNMLPLESAGVNNSFQHFPEVPLNVVQLMFDRYFKAREGCKWVHVCTQMSDQWSLFFIDSIRKVIAATRALYTSEWSQFPRFESEYSKNVERDVLDIFDFLHYAFCFQKDNVSNQREYLILLLADAESRVGTLSEETDNAKLDVKTVEKVHDLILANYVRWCDFLKQSPQTKLASNPQKQLCLTALYLLIWGEAANIRFPPECLCYTFHHMAGECFTLLDKKYVERSPVSIKLIKEMQHEDLLELHKNYNLVPVNETVEKVRYHLVLDVNGVLCDVNGSLANLQLRWRPNLRSFLQFCHKNFIVIYWSACRMSKLEYLVGELSKFSGVPIDREQCMSQTECLVSNHRDKDKPQKPIFLKPLSKVYEAFPGANATNTLLIDDSPDKNALNHPDNSIHPLSFKTFTSVVDRHSLLNLKDWLEGLLASNGNVQGYVLRNRPADGYPPIHGDRHRLKVLLSGAFG